MGLVTRSSTSRGDAPGIYTKTSTIGTMIWGSSSRGNFQTANTPSKTEPAITRGVSFELIQARANVPAGPRFPVRLIGEPLLACHHSDPRESEQSPGRL